ncbi:MAG: asparagine synthase (glutamine-hydrolyzing) [Burkholderiaceae bacterium]
MYLLEKQKGIMCGLAGHWQFDSSLSTAQAIETGKVMAQAIAHRGPDDCGIWVSAGGPCLVHQRLAVIDLSPAGHQPMLSTNGRFVLVFNGEIYNFLQLRCEVEAACGPVDWRGSSDTEVLLTAICTWGLTVTLPKLNGMFAIAVWDNETRSLTLARDRFGEKPLHYGYTGGSFLFGSELNALYAHPEWRGSLDTDAIADFLRLCYVPAPRTIFRNVRKLMPGCMITLCWADIVQKNWPKETPYWRAEKAALDKNLVAGSDCELIAETERKLQAAVALRMTADVPLGAFLSGGVDSSLVVAMMQSQSPRPVRSFSIGFEDPRYDEAPAAKKVANHLGTDHTQLYVSKAEVLKIIPTIPGVYDEPFGDSSQIPTLLVSQMARRHVTVALTGDGGDELFGGYNRHAWVPKIWRTMGCLPRGLRSAVSGFLLDRTPAQLDATFKRLQHLLPAQLHARTPGDKLHKLAGVLSAMRPNDIYAGLVSTTRDPQRYMTAPALGTDDQVLFPERAELAVQEWMMLSDTQNYLADDILVKVDRASMSTSLETRIPFLDPVLYDWAWRLPASLKVRDGQGKWILRQVLYRHVPPPLVDRPKAGFGIPMDALLRGPLRGWICDALGPASLGVHNILQAPAVNDALQRHMTGQANNAYLLWNLLVLTTWIHTYRNRIDL